MTSQFCLSQKDLFEDSDSFTRDIYGIHDDVLALVETDIARAVVDLSRDISDRPPENPDGIIKSETCHGHTIYSSKEFPDEVTFQNLVKQYYDPFHKKIQDLLNGPSGIKLALDCHSMEPIGPTISPDTGKERPSICLGNNSGKSCPDEWIQKLSCCLQKSFNLDEGDIQINKPFAGGHITRKYGNNPIPWIQIEMNRNLYLTTPWFDQKNLSVAQDRLNELRSFFLEGLKLFFS